MRRLLGELLVAWGLALGADPACGPVIDPEEPVPGDESDLIAMP